MASVDLFRTRDGRAYAKFRVDGRLQLFPVKSNAMRSYITHFLYSRTKRADSRVVSEVLDIVEAQALYCGPERDVFVRLARVGDCAYLDSGRDAEYVEVSPEGWKLIENPPVDFIRPPGMRALSTPIPCDRGLDGHHVHCGLEFEENSILQGTLACAVAGIQVPVLRTTGPRALSLAQLGRGLIDPHAVPLRSTPKDKHDLSICATYSGIVALGPERKLSQAQESALQRLTEGVAFGKRAMHSDWDEIVFPLRRPVILSHTCALKMSSEFEAGSIVIGLEDSYASDRQIKELLVKNHPAILGRILSAAVRVLRRAPDNFDEALDAVGEYFRLPVGGFAQIFQEQKTASRVATLDAFTAVRYLKELAPTEQTATALLAMLDRRATPEERLDSNWPTSAASLSIQLRRLQPHMELAGLSVEFRRKSGGKRERQIELIAVGQ